MVAAVRRPTRGTTGRRDGQDQQDGARGAGAHGVHAPRTPQRAPALDRQMVSPPGRARPHRKPPKSAQTHEIQYSSCHDLTPSRQPRAGTP
jgi:hypothetical protein